MKRFITLILLAVLTVLQAPAHAQARYYEQAELDALLAPVALYPDAVLTNVLIAATYPDDLRDAADWSRANPQLGGEDAVRATAPMPWHPSIKALVAFPELLARMDESPQWTSDLGAAFIAQEPQVMETVQGLRRRAQASGALQSNSQQQVVQQGPTVIVQPAQPQVIYVPYYDPYVVYGPWWWPAYRPVFWRPWYPRPAVFVSAAFFSGSVDWHRRHVTYVAPRRVFIQQVTINNGAQPPREHRGEWREQRRENRVEASRPFSVFNHVQQAQEASRIQERKLQEQRPIIQGAPLPPAERRGEWREQRRDQRTQAPRQMVVQNQMQQAQGARPIVQPSPPPQRTEWREQRREQRAEAPRQVAVQNQMQQAQARPIVQTAQIPVQMQRPAQYRVEAARPVAVQQRMPQVQAARPAAQSGQVQQRGQGQGHQHRGGRG
jgi:hypothetical protein